MARISPNVNSFLAGLQKSPDRLKARMTTLVRKIVSFTHEGVTSRTPVWTGQALRNYVWSTGTPAVGFKGRPSGETGETNKMAVGSEPLRAPAQAEADASKAALTFSDPYQKFYLTNNTPHIIGLEYGRYPLPPLRQRSPAGMVRVTVQELVTRLKSGAL